MLGQKEAMKLNSVPLSAKVVKERIYTFAQNVREQVISYINASKFFAIQLDETIDVSSNAQPMVYEQQSPSKDVLPPFGGMKLPSNSRLERHTCASRQKYYSLFLK